MITKNIFNEFTYAENLLRNGFSRFMNGTDINILAKYFRHKGSNNPEIESAIVSFCKKFILDFNETLYSDKIKKIIKRSEKSCLRLPVDVPITEKEIEAIKSINNYRYEKVVFTMLCIGKYFRLTNTGKKDILSENYFVNSDFSSILKIAHTSQKRGENIAYDLYKLGMIDYIKRTKSYIIKFTTTADDSKVAVVVSDMNNIISFYPQYCKICRQQLTRTGNRAKMHAHCYEKKRKEDKKRWWNENIRATSDV